MGTTKRVPLFSCQECGRKFYSTKAAERAAWGDAGCPGCGGSDIDLFVPEVMPTCPGCGEPAHATDSDDDGYHAGCRHEPEEREDVLCGCGWGVLGASLARRERLAETGCPVCGRSFDAYAGWATL